MKKFMVVLIYLGTTMAACGGSNGPEESARRVVMQTIERASLISPSTEDGLRYRVRAYIEVGQLMRNPARGEFAALSESKLTYYRDLIREYALTDMRALYGQYLRRTGNGTIMLGENEETFYWLWQAVQWLEIECRGIYNDSGCSADTLHGNGQHVAKLMITEKGGLLDQMHRDPNSTEAARQINYLIMRWGLWKDLSLTESDRIRIATSMVGNR